MRSALAVVFCLPLVLTGCALNSSDAPTADLGLAIKGSIHGGQQPIVGSHVYLLAASSSVYGAASQSLLTSVPGSTTLDTSGGPTTGFYYVTSGTGGAFSISGDYSCTPNTQVYIYAVGGNPGAGPNAAAGLLAVLGNCPSTGNFLTSVSYIVVNEVSTIAAAYAFSGFATDATHVASANTALSKIGLQNAFANAANLDTLSTGTAPATTPAGNGIVPQATIYTLADILASCINSTGTIAGPTNPTPCYSLLTSATSTGAPGGTQPSDTATAAINIAHHPGSNVAALLGLITAQPPFGPTAILPNDFTLGLQFGGGGLNAPSFIAMDGSGNAWIANNGASSVTELASTGAPVSTSSGFTGGGMNGVVGISIDLSGNAWVANDLAVGGSIIKLSSVNGSVLSGSGGYTGGGLGTPYAIAVDGSGNSWVTNSTSNTITELSSAGTGVALSPYSLGGLNQPQSIAIDASGNAWIANAGSNTVSAFNSAGTPFLQSPFSVGLNSPSGIAIDHSGNVWIPNAAGNSITKLSSSGSQVSGSPFSGNTDQPESIAIDGSGNVWTANELGGSVSELSTTGATLSGPNGYGFNDNSIDLPVAVAIDGSGNVWIGNLSGTGAAAATGSITELVGAATPVVTPLSTGVKNNTLGTRP
ncbi:MAG: NHL repeat-containing protein [Acidobacteriota bacterium]|nr:NHL repeat-containing protein [Acidobacteriota bacterium]